MPSRAFFRCRACGEPVVAGAYRCPVCGTNFPAGQPAVPEPEADTAPSSPSAPDTASPQALDDGLDRQRPGDHALARMREREVARAPQTTPELTPTRSAPAAAEPEAGGLGDGLGAAPAGDRNGGGAGRSRGRQRAKRDALPLMGGDDGQTPRRDGEADSAARQARQKARRERAQRGAAAPERTEPSIAPEQDPSAETNRPSDKDIFSEPLDARQFEEGLDFEDNLEREIRGDAPAAIGVSDGEDAPARKAGQRSEPHLARDELAVAPVRDAGGEKADGVGAASVLSVRPAELRSPSPPPAEAENDRRRPPMVAEPSELQYDEDEFDDKDEDEADAPAPPRPKRRRSKADALTGTFLAGLVVVAGAFAASIFAPDGDEGADTGQFARALGVPTVIAHGEGWVNIPSGNEPLSLSAQGPFRVRVGGTVYTIEGGKTLSLSREDSTAIAVRAIDPAAAVEVTLQR